MTEARPDGHSARALPWARILIVVFLLQTPVLPVVLPVVLL